MTLRAISHCYRRNCKSRADIEVKHFCFRWIKITTLGLAAVVRAHPTFSNSDVCFWFHTMPELACALPRVSLKAFDRGVISRTLPTLLPKRARNIDLSAQSRTASGQRRQASRLANGTAEEVRVHRQSQNRETNRPHDSPECVGQGG